MRCNTTQSEQSRVGHKARPSSGMYVSHMLPHTPAAYLPGGGASSARSVCSMPRTFRSMVSSLSTGRSALLPAASWVRQDQASLARVRHLELEWAGNGCYCQPACCQHAARPQRGQQAQLPLARPLLHSCAPEGSPTRPVAPPSSATGTWPHRWNQASTRMPSRLPRCRLSAVGSNPQYASSCSWVLTGPISGEVMSCSSPRERSTATTSCSCAGLPAAAADGPAGCGSTSTAAAAARGRAPLAARPRHCCCRLSSAARGLH